MRSLWPWRGDAVLWFALALLLLIVIGVPLEGWRQARKLKKTGGQSTGARMLGAGALELQHLLQADRRVEILQRQQKEEEVVSPESQRSGEGE